MRPLFSALFVFSVFGLLAAHTSNGLLTGYLSDHVPQALALINQGIGILLIEPLGREVSVYTLLGAGAFFALWAYVAEATAQQNKRQERFSTW